MLNICKIHILRYKRLRKQIKVFAPVYFHFEKSFTKMKKNTISIVLLKYSIINLTY